VILNASATIKRGGKGAEGLRRQRKRKGLWERRKKGINETFEKQRDDWKEGVCQPRLQGRDVRTQKKG